MPVPHWFRELFRVAGEPFCELMTDAVLEVRDWRHCDCGVRRSSKLNGWLKPFRDQGTAGGDKGVVVGSALVAPMRQGPLIYDSRAAVCLRRGGCGGRACQDRF